MCAGKLNWNRKVKRKYGLETEHAETSGALLTPLLVLLLPFYWKGKGGGGYGFG
jgi:hypothetical protein